ncbi:uncharacterized protein BDZ99DRAFT_165874 [Mytilinidion resinicola]|uniref:Uncharacterized protein n=1 Tax=Mytilinidion resinicola TaxID=574789 RepID=A0A6A6Y6S4_9PEZI|nr:uncharacterized protein BDZ99DRAFT_165874 [Mytilinidion resinicola]KAF2803507.1 hypothetical protein BDZ99DRAFT_165874 [Mytilinidion resinicola]
MTCTGRESLSTPSFERFAFDQSFSSYVDRSGVPESPHPTFQRARRPALIPPNPSLTLAEAEELVGNRINRPLFPPPDPKIINQLSPQQSSSSENAIPQSSPPHLALGPQPLPDRPFPNEEDVQTAARCLFPTSLVPDTRRRASWLKARAHYARDRKIRLEGEQTSAQSFEPVMPKRKHSAFLLDEEMKCHREDVVGTPHLSEMVPGDDAADEIGVDSLSMGDPTMMEIPEGNAATLSPQCRATQWFGGSEKA